MQKIYKIFLLSCFVCLAASLNSAEPDLDQKIAELKSEREQARIHARIAANDADRLLTRDWLGYQRALTREEHYQEEMQTLSKQIDALEKQKEKK